MIFYNRKTKNGVRRYTRNVSKYTYDCYKKQRRKYNRKYYSSSGKFPTRDWSDEDEMSVVYSGLSDRELSEELQRSVASIQKRRYKILHEGREWLNKDAVVNKASVSKCVVTTT